MEDKKRDYQKEYENERNKIKRYTLRVPVSTAKAFDEKLKKENKKYSEVLLLAIDKYLKK
ncbi:MAG: hypothetical protein HFJ30_00170 [Clostridia bacterium]|jgi:hypothetical protein|nr:hypothetical protein [Clostridia bacterium]